LYCKKKTSRRNPEHPVYPYLLRGLTIEERGGSGKLDKALSGFPAP
jgi:hypothetical protein